MHSKTRIISLMLAASIAGLGMAGSSRAANLVSASAALSNHKPLQEGVVQVITAMPATDIPGPGFMTISWPAGFDFNTVIASSDVSVSGGGIGAWNPVQNSDLNLSSRVLTLVWPAGETLQALAPVTVTIGFTKNPAAGEYNIAVQTVPAGGAGQVDTRYAPVVITNGDVDVTAQVQFPQTNPSIGSITPAETIIISSGTPQVIRFEITDVNNDPVDFSINPSTGSVSLPSGLATDTKDGAIVEFTYFADGLTGLQSITVTLDDNENSDPTSVLYDISLFVI